MVGDGRVGKTSLVLRYTQDTFSPTYKETLGANFAVRDLRIGKAKVKLVIWDIAGQPSFRQVRRHYFMGSHGALLVFDVTNPASFMSLKDWYNSLKRVAPDSSVILVGNKTDLADERRVPPAAARMLRDWWGIPYVETSAATGRGVNEAFRSITQSALEHANAHLPTTSH